MKTRQLKNINNKIPTIVTRVYTDLTTILPNLTGRKVVYNRHSAQLKT